MTQVLYAVQVRNLRVLQGKTFRVASTFQLAPSVVITSDPVVIKAVLSTGFHDGVFGLGDRVQDEHQVRVPWRTLC